MMQSLDAQRELFKQRRFLAMPLAGAVIWAIIGMVAMFASETVIIWSIWIGCGSIFYLGMVIAKLTGEDFFGKKAQKNAFDGLFMAGVVMSLLVFAIAMPVAAIDHKTIPLTVGILAGLMWMPLSWIIQHWVGYFHSIARTLGIVMLWLLVPEHIYTLIPLWIVLVYSICIIVMERRYKTLKATLD
ncbi:DUF7010 family protein [Alteromonas sediminis]|nr:hypothetical protein [Alteromonas sediminis]